MYKISFFCPVDQAEKIKLAMFAVGAGKIGNYDCCSWECLGSGQFRPLAGSNPFIGRMDKIEKVPELKIEMVCDSAFIQNAIAALKANHPYETPAYEVYQLENF